MNAYGTWYRHGHWFPSTSVVVQAVTFRDHVIHGRTTWAPSPVGTRSSSQEHVEVGHVEVPELAVENLIEVNFWRHTRLPCSQAGCSLEDGGAEQDPPHFFKHPLAPTECSQVGCKMEMATIGLWQRNKTAGASVNGDFSASKLAKTKKETRR